MKKIILTLVSAFALNTISAQDDATKTNSIDYNKWSVELSGGFNKPEKPLTYSTELISPFTVDLGVRYMLNNKFGLKVDAGYNSLKGKDNSFESKYYRVDIQGVANLGRILSFETWTKTLGLLAHSGFGVAQLEDDNSSGKDKIGNFIIGVTGQIKLSNKFVVTGDLTAIRNARQAYAYDFASINTERGFSGSLFTGTVGLTYYIGKNAKHADWFVENEGRFEELETKLADLETKLTQDTDKDGVPDYIDEESITPAGAVVDAKGRSLDKNNNGVPDATEAYILKNYGNPEDKSPVLTNNDVITNLINGGYVAVYFDFNKATPTASSTGGTSFILAYLRNNPTASVDIIGNADEIGNTQYNQQLSNERANNVKNTLIKSGIDASRLNVIAAGEDKSVDKSSDDARKLVRRVIFTIK
ncbi:MAG: OmpA family protein [Bacteroidota bacterium]